MKRKNARREKRKIKQTKLLSTFWFMAWAENRTFT
jgi:hypothetical protein